ncbi:hypothetical protein [Mannheimia pernigra]|uniref:hypothetical protein n=1 Tax=Mannheimia pernigra TaxID=111844 RepID=UPI00159F4D6C|nr:hypothetical protein [Mannheimia pernigra]QLB44842.1 hypothetical protein HV561_08910 [Mannheimia pernigra]
MFSERFLDSVKNHSITIIQNSDDTKIFQASIPNEGSHLAFTVIYQSNRVIITGDMGSFVLGGLLNPYGFFLKNQSAFGFYYMASKVLAEDRNFRTHIFDANQAQEMVEGLFKSYMEDREFDDSQEEILDELRDKIESIDFSSQIEVERFLYELSSDEWEIFDELDINDFNVLSYQFMWCIQAIIWITRKISVL